MPLSDRHAQPDWTGGGFDWRQMVQAEQTSLARWPVSHWTVPILAKGPRTSQDCFQFFFKE